MCKRKLQRLTLYINIKFRKKKANDTPEAQKLYHEMARKIRSAQTNNQFKGFDAKIVKALIDEAVDKAASNKGNKKAKQSILTDLHNKNVELYNRISERCKKVNNGTA